MVMVLMVVMVTAKEGKRSQAVVLDEVLNRVSASCIIKNDFLMLKRAAMATRLYSGDDDDAGGYWKVGVYMDE